MHSFCTCVVIHAKVLSICQEVYHFRANDDDIDPMNPFFILCPPEHVISILSAKAGSIQHQPNDGQCEPFQQTCQLSTDELDEQCNERQWCIVEYFENQENQHCRSTPNTGVYGYAVTVIYHCIKSKWSCLLLQSSNCGTITVMFPDI